METPWQSEPQPPKMPRQFLPGLYSHHVSAQSTKHITGAHTLVLWEALHTDCLQTNVNRAALSARWHSRLLQFIFRELFFLKEDALPLAKALKPGEEEKQGREDLFLLKQFQQNYNYC